MAREALGIANDGLPKILAIADYLNERRKGGDLLMRALARLTMPVTLLTVGHDAPRELPANVTPQHLGYIEYELAKVLAYNAADLVVHPAPVDNFPNTVIEATACGVPVLAFDTGGLSEMVIPSKTGWLALPITAEAFGIRLDEAVTETRNGLPNRLEIRRFAEERYDNDRQGKCYQQLFAELLAAA
jgi:glycosyltransferase involved in cell wall biosynthesis